MCSADNVSMAAAGTRVPVGYSGIYYPGNFLPPDTTRVPELEKSRHVSVQSLFN